MLPAVRQAVCGRALPEQPATLADYVRYRFRGRVYPGIVPAPGASTEGALVEGIDAGLWARLDRFETDLYERLEVEVATADGTRTACAYVVAPRHRGRLSRAPWCPQGFAARDLAAYLARWT
jgi:gamma-glutamylcyclotransferase (GGCT)/AIG2-like uncharacterized protein YtfP